VWQGEDHNCLEQLARYLRDEYRDKRKQQVCDGGSQAVCEIALGHHGALPAAPFHTRLSPDTLTAAALCFALHSCPSLPASPLQRDDVLDWPREFPKRIPQQLNGCDCGVFTLLFANYAGRDAPLTFSQAHIDDLRVRIVHELLQLRVE
jgi:hypothetical protein